MSLQNLLLGIAHDSSISVSLIRPYPLVSCRIITLVPARWPMGRIHESPPKSPNQTFVSLETRLTVDWLSATCELVALGDPIRWFFDVI